MCSLTVVLLACGAAAAVAAWLLWCRRAWWIAASSATALVALTLLAAGGYSVWYHHRPQPAPAEEALFDGVTYAREVPGPCRLPSAVARTPRRPRALEPTGAL